VEDPLRDGEALALSPPLASGVPLKPRARLGTHMVLAAFLGVGGLLLGLLAWGLANADSSNEPIRNDEDLIGRAAGDAIAEFLARFFAWVALIAGVAALILSIGSFRSRRAGDRRRSWWLIIAALGVTACAFAVIALITV
jgi:cytosine/uracil/thiamine/allantoin permease